MNCRDLVVVFSAKENQYFDIENDEGVLSVFLEKSFGDFNTTEGKFGINPFNKTFIKAIKEKGLEKLSKDELEELKVEFCKVDLSKSNFLTKLIYEHLFPQDNSEFKEENLKSIPDLMFEVFKNVFKKEIFDIETIVFKTEDEVKKFFLNKLEQNTSKKYKTTLAVMEVPTKEEIYNKLTETGKSCRYTFCSLEVSEWTGGIRVYSIGSGD